MKVAPKKHLGQHFLTSEDIAFDIANTLVNTEEFENILEIGPGMGMMTKYLKTSYPDHLLKVIELDQESVNYLDEEFPDLEVIFDDFLRININTIFNNQFAIIGNFPYNISTQIIFRIIENKELIPQMSGMFQKEVAERICAEPNSKIYGITSVLTQAFYDTEYLFSVSEKVFNPPPKVQSGVIRLTRKDVFPDCEIKKLFYIVKKSFNQRRKMLRKSLNSDFTDEQRTMEIFTKRPENLSVEDFVYLVKLMVSNLEANKDSDTDNA